MINKITESKIRDWIFENTGKIISNSEFTKNEQRYTKEYLSELLDPEDSPEYDMGDSTNNEFTKTIKIDGETFVVNVEPSLVLVGFYKFSFKLVHSQNKSKPTLANNDMKQYIQDLNTYEYGLTNTGNPIKILKTLQSMMFTFIKKNNPRGISFKDFDEGIRGKTYSYMAKKLKSKTGYSLLCANHYFWLFKDNSDMIEFEKGLK
jgi:hypothetical protein